MLWIILIVLLNIAQGLAIITLTKISEPDHYGLKDDDDDDIDGEDSEDTPIEKKWHPWYWYQ